MIDNAGHNDLALLTGEEMIEEIVTFLGEALADGGAEPRSTGEQATPVDRDQLPGDVGNGT